MWLIYRLQIWLKHTKNKLIGTYKQRKYNFFWHLKTPIKHFFWHLRVYNVVTCPADWQTHGGALTSFLSTTSYSLEPKAVERVNECQYSLVVVQDVASYKGEFVLSDGVWIAKGISALYVL